jgi:hypothetical protein
LVGINTHGLEASIVPKGRRGWNNEPGRVILVAVGVGLLVGAVSFLLQGRLPGDWSYLGNSGAVWMAPAFGVGALARRDRWAALAGFTALAACLVGYFAAGMAWGVPYGLAFIVYWSLVAVVGGPLAGVAGRWWRHADVRWRRALGLALLGGVFVAEGVYTLRYNAHLSVGWPLFVTGVLAPLLLGRSMRDRLWGLAALVPMALAGVAAYEVLVWANSGFGAL